MHAIFHVWERARDRRSILQSTEGRVAGGPAGIHQGGEVLHIRYALQGMGARVLWKRSNGGKHVNVNDQPSPRRSLEGPSLLYRDVLRLGDPAGSTPLPGTVMNTHPPTRPATHRVKTP